LLYDNEFEVEVNSASKKIKTAEFVYIQRSNKDSMAPNINLPEAEIREQLNRILCSAPFKSSRVLSDFLRFVADFTLAGKEREIKEYSIGIRVLSREKDFNPQLDSVVRIHAGRLRRALKEYYYEYGKKDSILIDIPKGGYIPIFSQQNNETDSVYKVELSEDKLSISPLKTDKPVIAVMPFRNISDSSSRDFFADGLGEQLSTELTWFHDLTIISYYSTRHASGLTGDIKEVAKLLGAQYLITGSIQTDEKHLRVRIQLVDGINTEQLWAQSFERDNSAPGLFEIQQEIVRNILNAIGGYYGVIFRNVYKKPIHNKVSEIETYDAIFWYYHYQKVATKDVMQKTISALEAAVKADPKYALAWAMLGEIYLDDKIYEFTKVANPAEEGLKCAQRAVNIDPQCQHGYQALAWIYLFHHNKEECQKAVDQCISINPNAADMVGGMGFVLICAGEFERGIKLLQESVLQNPFCAWWFNGGFVFYFLYKKQYNDALYWAVKLNVPEILWDPLLKASVLGHLNRIEEAGANLKLLLQIVPDAGLQVSGILESFLLSPQLVTEILEGLRKAGLVVKNVSERCF
jgi:TolB-like protein